ncbi:MAG: anhydro-N-acetylmuramic acid kinase [Alphaproteobacteria bacterium]|nr:anhydro-N-acetylmuramic acid kinase [Alphaproteobacteria bacterium]
MSKICRAIGLMSGTSLDGIDVALLETDGEGHVQRGPSATYAYDASQQARLRQALQDALEIRARNERPGSLAAAEMALTDWHANAVHSFLQERGLTDSKIDVIGFHGQTVLHRPEQRLTVQLGDGAALARATGIDVVYDMRAADVAAGGQGAPLVPIYHAALAKTRPAAFVNIGGVANVTYVGDDVLAFDTGPGNALINDWMMKHKGLSFDEGGKTCLSGSVGRLQLASALNHPYFAQKPPKSLDRNAMALVLKDFGLADGAATLAAFTAHSIAAAAKWFPKPPKQWVICGGGRHNAAIMQTLRGLLPNVVTAEDLGLNGDSMEAEAWAYLAVRSLRGLPLTFPGTTGVAQPLTGGVRTRA